MRICLITYDFPHRKTTEIALGLYKRGFRHIDYLLMPFILRNRREVFFSHRPNQFEGHSPYFMAGLFKGLVHPYSSWKNIVYNYDYFLICGSNIIEADFVDSANIINAHSGLIPEVRGLDSFKWAILHRKPLGVTLHKIDSETDMGEIYSHLHTPILLEDNLSSLANRHYYNEIWMLTNFDRMLNGPRHMLPKANSTKRMPYETEIQMIANFSPSSMLTKSAINGNSM